MHSKILKIVWSKEAQNDLNDIEDYYSKTSPDKAIKNILHIILEVEKIVFLEQWQIDEFDVSCRRMIVDRKFRVLYKIIDQIILITAVYPTQKNPKNILKT